jgi:hypothetical protein
MVVGYVGAQIHHEFMIYRENAAPSLCDFSISVLIEEDFFFLFWQLRLNLINY